jgi:putative hemolysin
MIRVLVLLAVFAACAPPAGRGAAFTHPEAQYTIMVMPQHAVCAQPGGVIEAVHVSEGAPWRQACLASAGAPAIADARYAQGFQLAPITAPGAAPTSARHLRVGATRLHYWLATEENGMGDPLQRLTARRTWGDRTLELSAYRNTPYSRADIRALLQVLASAAPA